jgi:hypothetical protein
MLDVGRINADVFREGQQARLENVPVLANPYVRGTLRDHWDRGWIAADLALRTGNDTI